MSESPPVSSRPRRLFAWPGWRHLGLSCGLGLFFAIWLEVIYGGADYITSLRALRVPVHFPWELAIPFIPAMTVVYMSILPLFWIAPFVLRTGREMVAFISCLALATLCAGVMFLLVPAQLAYSSPDVPRHWAWIYNVTDMLNLDYNLVPSLHVTFAALCADIYSRHCGATGRLVLWGWGLAIALATLLIHAHHVLDVAAGFMLAFLVSRCFYDRWAVL